MVGVSPDFGLTEPLGVSSTVIQSEGHAIEVCAKNS